MSILPHPLLNPHSFQVLRTSSPPSKAPKPGRGGVPDPLGGEWITSSTSCVGRGWGPVCAPPCAQDLPTFLLDSSPCPQHALGTASEGESLATGLASTSQDGEGLPPSRPALCPELKGDERGIVSQPKRRSPQVAQERLCGRLPAVIPSSLWGLSQAWGDSLWCTKGGLLPQLSGLQAELQDSLTFSAETSFSTSGPSRPLCRAQRGQEPGDGEEEGGQRRARQEA